jgi:hypothetical protein
LSGCAESPSFMAMKARTTRKARERTSPNRSRLSYLDLDWPNKPMRLAGFAGSLSPGRWAEECTGDANSGSIPIGLLNRLSPRCFPSGTAAKVRSTRHARRALDLESTPHDQRDRRRPEFRSTKPSPTLAA